MTEFLGHGYNPDSHYNAKQFQITGLNMCNIRAIFERLAESGHVREYTEAALNYDYIVSASLFSKDNKTKPLRRITPATDATSSTK